MDRLVITPWDGKNEAYLEECKESVKESGVEHLIVRCGPDWQEIMFSMRNDAEMIAWVDCDDIVYPGAIVDSFNLLESSGKAMVYTDEAMIDKDGRIIRESGPSSRTLFDLASHPMSIHHLHVTRRGSISERALKTHKENGCLLDWAMKVDAAATGGMAHLPIVGYGWRLHGKQMTAVPGFQRDMEANLPIFRKEFRSWIAPTYQGLAVRV